MKQLKTLLVALLACLLFGCEKEGCINEESCPPNIGCTEEFRSLLFQPIENGEAVLLDSYYVKNLDTNNLYNFTNNDSQDRIAAYVVVTDSQLNDVRKSGSNLRFIGSINNEVVIEQDFIVGHNCCHVIGIEGPFYGEN